MRAVSTSATYAPLPSLSYAFRARCSSPIALHVFVLVPLSQVDYGATPEEIQQHFQSCGTINRVTIICDKFTGHPKGFVSRIRQCFWGVDLGPCRRYAYVEFAEQEAIDASLAMDNSLFRGRLIKVCAGVRGVGVKAVLT